MTCDKRYDSRLTCPHISTWQPSMPAPARLLDAPGWRRTRGAARSAPPRSFASPPRIRHRRREILKLAGSRAGLPPADLGSWNPGKFDDLRPKEAHQLILISRAERPPLSHSEYIAVVGERKRRTTGVRKRCRIWWLSLFMYAHARTRTRTATQRTGVRACVRLPRQ